MKKICVLCIEKRIRFRLRPPICHNTICMEIVFQFECIVGLSIKIGIRHMTKKRYCGTSAIVKFSVVYCAKLKTHDKV